MSAPHSFFESQNSSASCCRAYTPRQRLFNGDETDVETDYIGPSGACSTAEIFDDSDSDTFSVCDGSVAHEGSVRVMVNGRDEATCGCQGKDFGVWRAPSTRPCCRQWNPCVGACNGKPPHLKDSYYVIAKEVCERSREVVLESVAKDGSALRFASPEVRGDAEVVLRAVLEKGRALRYAGAALRADREIVLAAVAQDGRALEFASSDLRRDWVVVQTAVAQNGRALRFAAEEFRADHEVVLTAVSGSPLALRFAAPVLRGNRQIVKAAVLHDGWALRLASEELRGDRDVVLAAVAQSGSALRFASEALRDDREVVRAALIQDPHALECASYAMRADPDLVITAVLRDGAALEYAARDLRHDPEMVLASSGEDGAIFPYVPKEKRVLPAVHSVPRPGIARVRLPLAPRFQANDLDDEYGAQVMWSCELQPHEEEENGWVCQVATMVSGASVCGGHEHRRGEWR